MYEESSAHPAISAFSLSAISAASARYGFNRRSGRPHASAAMQRAVRLSAETKCRPSTAAANAQWPLFGKPLEKDRLLEDSRRIQPPD
jgi:hypothetical protein